MRYHLADSPASQQISLSTKGLRHAQVAIVGAGPRGTSALERLCASAPEYIKAGTKLTVHVVDPYPAGAGCVWRTTQSKELLMNTVSSQITLFTDKTVDCDGPIRSGPSLYQWAVKHDTENGNLGPDQYPTRGQYGRYLRWVFSETLKRAPDEVEVVEHAARAIRLDSTGPNDRQALTLDNGRTLSGLSAVVLAQGHLPLQENPKEQILVKYARENGLGLVLPSNPADVDLSDITSNENVVLRGLGLNFFDYMALLSAGRGGKFIETENGLRYEKSGNEPRMYAGSRRGVPYQARGDNAKGAYGRHMAQLLTEDVVAGFRKRADAGDYPDFLNEIWPLVAKEVEVVYYEGVLKTLNVEEEKCVDFRTRFLATAHKSTEETQVIDEFGLPHEKRWSWDRISCPYGNTVFNSHAEWREWMVGYLREDAAEAALGNVEGPLKASLDVMRDLRNELRLIVDHRGLSGPSRQHHLDSWYTPLNAYLSIGPPRQRIEQMIALIDAGVLEILGPHFEVRSEDGAWIAVSPEVPDLTVRATTLIEARLPEINLKNTGDDLLAYMLKTGQCRPHMVDGHETEGLDVTESPYKVIDAKAQGHDRKFAVGVPTEGVHWVTAAGARPGVNSVTLLDTDAVARAALDVVAKETQVAQEQAKAKVEAQQHAQAQAQAQAQVQAQVHSQAPSQNKRKFMSELPVMHQNILV